MPHRQELAGKIIYITGGTGGIGVPLVRMLREAGTQVELYERERDGDLSEHLDGLCEKLRNLKPDILINMAGFNDLNYAEDQDYEAILHLNLIAPMRLTQAVLPAMKARKNGQIINIGSMTALIPLPHLTGYVAAKAGLKGFNDALRRELGGTGITVTHIVPRAVKTAMNSGVKAEVNARTKVRYDDPEKIAARIFKAILEHKTEIRFGWPERFFAFLNTNFPLIIDGGLQKNREIGEDVLNTHKTGKEKLHETDQIFTRRTAS
ncbi:MAG: SDR family NAD(P)-dependent oxidoreductase [Alphaproteobacteria bacterium]|nr:SDR family NAD(P)-dependent oxidoreductase [Alphaproteobacteria bacterium]